MKTIITSADEVIEIESYNYDSADKDTLTIGTGENVINIYYTKRTDLSYTVNYLEKDTNKVLHDQKVADNQIFETVIHSADEVITIDGYNYDSVDKDTLTIGTGENVINIYYTKRTDLSYTVNYLEKGTDKVLQSSKVQENVTFGTDILSSEEIIEIAGYNYDCASADKITVGTDVEKNVINLYYVKRTDLSYTVNYLEKDTNKLLHESKTVNEQVFETIIDSADEIINIIGYVFESANPESLIIGTENNVMNLYYVLDPEQTVDVTYISASEAAGTVSNAKDSIQIITADGLKGSSATAKEGYAFAGWYKGDKLVSENAILDTETIKNYLNVSKETDTYEATEFIAHWKGLEVTKEATSAVDSEGNAKDVTNALSLGDTVTYTITVKNIGTVSLSNIVVSDEMAGVQLTQESSWEIASLGAGEVSAPIKVTYTIQESDLGKTLVNVATATVKEDPDVPVKPGEESNETDDPNPSFTATKSIASDQQESTFGVGDTVTFAITVENTGNVTLNNVTVGEELTDAVIERGTGYSVENNVATITTLAPGKNVVVYAKYVVKQTDVDDADLVNTATVNAKDPEGKDLEEEKPSVEVPTDEQAPGMVAEKEIANPEAATGKDGKFKVGDTVEF